MPITCDENPLYKSAENNVAAALSTQGVVLHGSQEETKFGPDMQVAFSGAPRTGSFSERVRNDGKARTEDGKINTGDNRELLSICITPGFDLRGAPDGEVVQKTKDALQALLSGDKFAYNITGKDGQPKPVHLADAFDWKGDAPNKIEPKINISDGVTNGKIDNEIHVTLNLPAGVTHWGVVDAIAGEKPLTLKPVAVGEMVEKLAGERAEAANAPQVAVAAPAPVPVIGDATAKVAESRAAAVNDDQKQRQA